VKWRGERPRHPLTLVVFAAAWIAVFCNDSLWSALWALPENQSARGVLFIAGFAGMIAALTAAVLALLAWRPLVKIAITVFLVSAAFGAHFMSTYSVVIDPTMMLNVVQTDPAEVRDLLSWRLAAYVLLLAVLPLLLVWRTPLVRLSVGAQVWRNLAAAALALVVLAGLVMALYADLSGTMRNHRTLRYMVNPLTSFYSLGVVVHEANRKPPGPPQTIGADASIAARPPGAKPPLLLLVVGETARADHFALNGYPRPTNPELSKVDGVVSYTDVTSCGTNTAASLPCMFSHLGKRDFESRSNDYENLLDVVQRAGMAVLWIDNQAGCKGVCDRVPHADAGQPAAGAPALPAGLCSDGECLDEALLEGLDARVAALPAEARARGVLLVMHQMGSHGPAYYKRSTPQLKRFLPECKTISLAECSHTELVNAYDNSIAYTDHFLGRTIDWLQSRAKDFDTGLLYMSDHGESLGEYGLFLHGLPYALAPDVQKHVPMVAWFSDGLARRDGTSIDCLSATLDAPLSHDNLFHTVLGLMDIRSPAYRSELDAFSCRNRRAG